MAQNDAVSSLFNEALFGWFLKNMLTLSVSLFGKVLVKQCCYKKYNITLYLYTFQTILQSSERHMDHLVLCNILKDYINYS